MSEEIKLLRDHADRCRVLAQRMSGQCTIFMLTRMADECNELADSLEEEVETGAAAKT